MTPNALALVNTAADLGEGPVEIAIIAAAQGWSPRQTGGIVKRAMDNGYITKPGPGVLEVTPAGLLAASEGVNPKAKKRPSMYGGVGIEAIIDDPPTQAGATSAIVAALENLWRAVQAQFPEIPDATVLVVSERRKAGLRGYFGADWWSSHGTHEVAVTSARLNDGAEAVASTLVHEAAHALAHARRLKDTSRQGRWHNLAFKEVAEELGLEVGTCRQRGHHTDEGLCIPALSKWGPQIKALGLALADKRWTPPAKPAPKKRKPRVSWKAVVEDIEEAMRRYDHDDAAGLEALISTIIEDARGD